MRLSKYQLTASVLISTCCACSGSDPEPGVDQETTGMGGDTKDDSSGDSNASTVSSTTHTDSMTGVGGNTTSPGAAVNSVSFNSTKACSGTLCVTANLVTMPPICFDELCIRQGKF